MFKIKWDGVYALYDKDDNIVKVQQKGLKKNNNNLFLPRQLAI